MFAILNLSENFAVFMLLLIRAAIEGAKISFAIFSILGPMPSSTGVLAEFNPLINSDTCVMEIKGISDGCHSVFYQ